MAARAAAAAVPARAPQPRAKPKPQSRPTPRAERRPRPRRLVASGVAWIVVLAVLLAGIVALNVAALQLNLKLDQLGRERANLRAENAQISAQVSSAASTPQIEQLASDQLGLTPAGLEGTTYVDLAPRR